MARETCASPCVGFLAVPYRRARACPSPCSDFLAVPYRRARACPSPCSGCIKNRPWPLGCGRLSFWRKDRGGQAPALRSKRRFSVGANTRGGQAHALRHLKHPASHRRARACPSPSIKRDRKRPWPLGCGRFSFGGESAGDRPPHYVPSDVFRLDRTLAGDRHTHYGT